LAGFRQGRPEKETDKQLTATLEKQEKLTKETSRHLVKILFGITDAMIRMTSRNSSTKEEMTEQLSGRIHALANANALVRRSFGDHNAPTLRCFDIRPINYLAGYNVVDMSLAVPFASAVIFSSPANVRCTVYPPTQRSIYRIPSCRQAVRSRRRR
jgi:thiamine pyrophosphate-dependent acetolactate synthase large subunit-like protein